MLNLHIYDTQRSAVPAELHPWMDINEREWDLAWGTDDPDGYRVGFYTPKVRGNQDSGSLCPPVLVFRGSDSDEADFEELAFAYELALRARVDKPLLYEDIDESFNFEGSFGIAPALNGQTFAQMRTKGLHEEVLFSEASGTERFAIDAPLWFEADVRIDWSLKVSLFYGTSGDWAVNFAQGLGRNIPAQYTKAIADGERAANDAASNWNNRLIITGHSLGGGLASAAALKARKLKPDLVMRSVTFNAAGLHRNTAARANATLALAADVPVRAVHVKDEILNSMQSTSGRLVPFLADLLAWGRKTMPPAVANPSPVRGVSPGPMSLTGQTYAPKFQRLPILYTVNSQTLGPAMTEMDDIVGIANSASTVEQFVARLLAHIVDRLSAGRLLTSTEAESLQELAGNITVLPRFKERLLEAITSGGPVPQFRMTGSPYITGRIQPLVNNMFQDTVTLARILIASGEYHTFPPCAFTFLLRVP